MDCAPKNLYTPHPFTPCVVLWYTPHDLRLTDYESTNLRIYESRSREPYAQYQVRDQGREEVPQESPSQYIREVRHEDVHQEGQGNARERRCAGDYRRRHTDRKCDRQDGPARYHPQERGRPAKIAPHEARPQSPLCLSSVSSVTSRRTTVSV